MNDKIKKIAVLTSGGDCPGLNAFISSLARVGLHDTNGNQFALFGVRGSQEGLIKKRFDPIHPDSDLSFMYEGRGGSRLISNSSGKTEFDYALAAANLKNEGFDVLVVIGGDGSFDEVFKPFADATGFPIIYVPKTVDNDVPKTDYCLGFLSAVRNNQAHLEKLINTGDSHNRITVVEAMGRGYDELPLSSASGSVARTSAVITYAANPSPRSIAERIVAGYLHSKELQEISEEVAVDIINYPLGQTVILSEGFMFDDDRAVLQMRSGKTVEVASSVEYVVNTLKRESAVILAEQGLQDIQIEFKGEVIGREQRGTDPCDRDIAIARTFALGVAELIREGRSGEMVAIQGSPKAEDARVFVPIEEVLALRPKSFQVESGLVSVLEGNGVAVHDRENGYWLEHFKRMKKVESVLRAGSGPQRAHVLG